MRFAIDLEDGVFYLTSALHELRGGGQGLRGAGDDAADTGYGAGSSRASDSAGEGGEGGHFSLLLEFR